jgi:hypothetical protein
VMVSKIDYRAGEMEKEEEEGNCVVATATTASKCCLWFMPGKETEKCIDLVGLVVSQLCFFTFHSTMELLVYWLR